MSKYKSNAVRYMKGKHIKNKNRTKQARDYIKRLKHNSSLFVNDMILYAEKLKHFTQRLIVVTNEISKVRGYKINIQKSIAFYAPIMRMLRNKS
jgi:hypothetical protein